MKKSNSKYPKLNYSNLDKMESVKRNKIACFKCKKLLIFFDFIRGSKQLESVWYCDNKECNEYRKFKF